MKVINLFDWKENMNHFAGSKYKLIHIVWRCKRSVVFESVIIKKWLDYRTECEYESIDVGRWRKGWTWQWVWLIVCCHSDFHFITQSWTFDWDWTFLCAFNRGQMWCFLSLPDFNERVYGDRDTFTISLLLSGYGQAVSFRLGMFMKRVFCLAFKSLRFLVGWLMVIHIVFLVICWLWK